MVVCEMNYDLTVEKLIGILTEIRDAGLGSSLVVIATEECNTPAPVANIKEAAVAVGNGMGGKQSMITDEGEGAPVVVIEEARMFPLTWFQQNVDSEHKTDKPIEKTMVVCANCGNKRCPHAANKANPCSRSNRRGQLGSNYP